jgi:hypothetical protein
VTGGLECSLFAFTAGGGGPVLWSAEGLPPLYLSQLAGGVEGIYAGHAVSVVIGVQPRRLRPGPRASPLSKSGGKPSALQSGLTRQASVALSAIMPC